MALTAQERSDLIELAVLMFNAAPGSTYLSELTAIYESTGRNLAVVANILAGTPAYTQLNPNYQTAEDFAAAFLAPLGLEGNDEAVDFIVAQFNAGASKGAIAYAAMEALRGYDGDNEELQAAKAALANKVEVAEYYSVTKGIAQSDLGVLQQVLANVTADEASVDAAKAAIDSGSGPAPTGYTLTTGIDNLTGTAGDNVFNAPVVQNDHGNLVNTLETGDVINGGAGVDTLNVVLTQPQGENPLGAPATSATLSGVEIVNYRSQYFNLDAINFSNIDAELHSGVQQYWSDNSRASLQIEDVRQLPEELTFGMRQTDPVAYNGLDFIVGSGSSYYVYFDPAQLAADRGSSGDSSLTLTLVDNSAADAELENFPVDGVVFTLDGVEYTVRSDAMGEAETYADFVAALQDALAANPALADITVTLNPNDTITLVDPDGATFGAVGYTWVGNVVPSAGELQWNMSVGAAVESDAPVTTNVVLDHVGRTSQGGELDIGSMAAGGVQVFNVSVDRDSWLTGMMSRGFFGDDDDHHLEVVNLSSIGAKGDLKIGDNTRGMTGELDGRVVGGLWDVREVRNVAFEGELNYGVVLTEDSIGRYLAGAEDEVVFTYEGGSGNDNITVWVDDILSGDDDFALDVSLGAGDDRLNLDVADAANVSVDGGTGRNTIAVARSHGTNAGNTFEGFTNFQVYEVEGFGDTAHDFTSMQGVETVVIANEGIWTSTELRDLEAATEVVISGKNQTLPGQNATNNDQIFDTISILGADATATDTTLRVTLQNTARLDGMLYVDELVIGDIPATPTAPADVNPIRTLELVSAGQRNTENIVDEIDALRVNNFLLSGTQDLAIRIVQASNYSAASAARSSLLVDGSELTGDLELVLSGGLVTAVDEGASSTVTLIGTGGDDDVLVLEGAITTTDDTSVSAFETIVFTDGAEGTWDDTNVNGVALYDIDETNGTTLSLIDMDGSARINVNINWWSNNANTNLEFDAAGQATTNVLDLEFRPDDPTLGFDLDFSNGGTTGIAARDYRTISLDLGGTATGDEDYFFNLLLQDAEGDDWNAPGGAAPAADVDAVDIWDAASVYVRNLVVVGGGDAGAVGGADGVDSVDLGSIANVISQIDMSGYIGRWEVEIVQFEDAVVDRNVTVTFNGYGANITETIDTFDESIVTYVFTGDAVSTDENWVINGFAAFSMLGVDLTNMSVLDMRNLGVNGFADLTIVYDGTDTTITSNEGLAFEIVLVGVDIADLSNENFLFAG